MTQNNLGTALKTLGERESGTETLQKAVEAFHEALKEYTRERVPLQWTVTQNNLGTALETLGERESYPKGKRWWVRLHEKGGKRHEMPAHHTRERVPLQ
jgi:hypothetical protein